MSSPDFNAINTDEAQKQYEYQLNISQFKSGDVSKANYVRIAGAENGNSGKYHINEAFEQSFLISYAITIFKNSIESTLSQLPTKEYSPLRFDFDFRGKLDKVTKIGPIPDGIKIDERLITEDLCIYVIDSIRDMLDKHFGTHKKIYLLTREFAQTIANDVIKDGIHVMVPDIHVSKYLHTELIRELQTSMSFKSYPEITNDIGSIIDKCIPTSSWILYGGKKKIGGHTYILSYEYEKELITPPTRSDDMLYHQNLVLLFSIHRSDQVYTSKIIVEKEKKVIVKTTPTIGNNNIEFDESDIETTKTILNKLPKKYYELYEEWYKIGFCIAGGTGRDPRFLPVWLDFSKKSLDNYNEMEAYRIWNDAKIGQNSLYHLFNLAKANLSEKEYEEIKNISVSNRLTKMILTGKTDELAIADLIASILKDTKRTEMINDKELDLYRFDNVWMKESSAKIVLLNDAKNILKTLVPEANKKASSIIINQNLNDNDTKSKHKHSFLTFNLIKLKKIVDALSQLNVDNGGIHQMNFSSLLDDKSGKIIAFKNCVIDLTTCEERPGLQSDNLSLYFPVNYKKYDPKSDEAIQLDGLLKDWFPNEKYREVVIDKLSLCLLYNMNGDNQVFFFKGSGKNGKSVFMNLIRYSFGVSETGFAKSVPVDFFIAGNKSTLGAASPDLVRTRTAKILLTEETNQNDKLNAALFKKISGGDMLAVRDLYKSVIEFKCAFRIFFAVNNMPKFVSIDDSLSRRIVIIPFENRFVLSPVCKNERKIIDDIDEIIKNISSCFMSYLVDNYKKKFMGKNKKKICIISDDIMKRTYEFINDSSPIKKFLNVTIIRTGNQNDKIDIEQLVLRLRAWASKNNYVTVAGYDITTIKETFEFEFGDSYNDKYIDSIKYIETGPTELN